MTTFGGNQSEDHIRRRRRLAGDEMRAISIRLIAGALVMAFLAAPAGVSAKERRGADIIITQNDGSQHRGELIAIKPDSLLLLSSGTDLTVARADIQSVRIVRRSRSGAAAGIGAAVGFIGGAAYVLVGYDSLEGPFKSRAQGVALVGIVAGGLGALGGLLVGSAAGADSTFAVAGAEDASLAAYWKKLHAQSREGRLRELARRP
jgi:hypothetical protein